MGTGIFILISILILVYAMASLFMFFYIADSYESCEVVSTWNENKKSWNYERIFDFTNLDVIFFNIFFISHFIVKIIFSFSDEQDYVFNGKMNKLIEWLFSPAK